MKQTRERSKLEARRLSAPWTTQRLLLTAVAMGMFVLVMIAMWQVGISPARLASGLDSTWSLMQRMWPPDSREWQRYLDALIVTIYMSIAGTVLAVALAIPTAIFAARNTTSGPFLYGLARAVITFTRVIPVIVFALIFVRAVGIGPVAGVFAMGINSIGMVGKLFSDAIEEVDQKAIEGVEATGASRLGIITTAILPQVMPAWIGLALYRFDINMRASVILGFVGAGGIGVELNRVLSQLVYDRALVIVGMLMLLIIGVEFISTAVRRAVVGDVVEPNPFGLKATMNRFRTSERELADRTAPATLRAREALRTSGPVRAPWTARRVRLLTFAGTCLLATAVSVRILEIDFVRIAASMRPTWLFMRRLWPPDFVSHIDTMLSLILETLWIAVAATGLGILVSLPIALLGARNTTPSRSAYFVARSAMLMARGIPDLVLALLFVVAVGFGPFAGVMALTIGSIGFTGKLMADALENVQFAGRDALRANGASWLQQTVAGVLPPAMPGLVGVGLFSFDVFFRSATILGIVGAGGIGLFIDQAVWTLQYESLAAVLVLMFAVIYIVERFSAWMRYQVK